MTISQSNNEIRVRAELIGLMNDGTLVRFCCKDVGGLPVALFWGVKWFAKGQTTTDKTLFVQYNVVIGGF